MARYNAAMSPLQGIRVLELARVLAGPWCGMTLADLGADVVKLEPPEGDDTRGWGPPFAHGLSAYFACCNRGKRSLALDLRDAAARPILEALVKRADVVIENYRTGGAEKLGVDYPTLRAINPRIIYCSISGYGREGPDAQRPGYDFAIQAEAGLMSLTGLVDGEPQRTGTAVADIAAGQNAAMAILAALFHRERSGEGQRVEVSLFDSQLQLLANSASGVLFTGKDAPRLGNQHPNIVPYQVFAASDAHFVLAVASENLWQRLCAAIDKPEWLADPRFAQNSDRVSNREVLCSALSELFSSRPLAHWLALFQEAGIPATPINTVKQAIAHPVTAFNGMRIELDLVPMIGSPLRLEQTPVRYLRAPPQLDQNRDEILGELALTEEIRI
jgi:crotonobetainyl-CoA:carnitine CoA-transferase CaiB-like acyl-CoA transferase